MSTTTTKSRPIIFSGDSVRAILDGRKTQTRRAVSWNNSEVSTPRTYLYDLDRAWRDTSFGGSYLHVPFAHPEDGWESDPKLDTFGRWYSRFEPGDTLWVREAWRPYWDHDDLYACVNYRSDGTNRKPKIIDHNTGHRFVEMCDRSADDNEPWRSPIHMPRWASRITLEITDVRVERLQDISEEDAESEGCESCCDGTMCMCGGTRAVDEFRSRWDALNAKRGFPWDSNPWVRVLTFRNVEATP